MKRQGKICHPCTSSPYNTNGDTQGKEALMWRQMRTVIKYSNISGSPFFSAALNNSRLRISHTRG
jgi:hypothetical protein